jgi:WD domain, G-beta repeat
MQLRGSAQLPGYIAKVRLHPNRHLLAALARTAQTDHLTVWQGEEKGRLAELVRMEATARPPDQADPPWLHRPPWPRRGRMMDIAFHPREAWLALVKQEEPAELFQFPHGTLLRRLGTAAAYDAIAFSGCGRRAIHSTPSRFLVPASDRNPCLYDLEADRATTLQWETDTTYAFHPSGRVAAGGWNCQGGGMVRFLELPYDPRRRVHEMDAPGWVDGLVFSLDGTSLAVIGGAGFYGHFCLEVYDFAVEPSPSVRRRFAKEWQVPLLPQRGRRSGRKERERQALLQEGQGFDLPWPERVVFSPEGSRLIYPGPSGELVEVDARSGEEHRRWPAHEKIVTSLDADLRRGIIASGGRDGRVLLWDADWSA